MIAINPLIWIEELGRYMHFATRALIELPSSFVRLRETARQLYVVLMGALPLAVAAGLAIGVVLWLHLRGVLERSGGGPDALHYLPTAISLAVLLEFAPIGAGLIVAGRTGASLGAELGAMRLTEQIDALEMLGLSTLRELIAPRLLACMLALPLLTFIIAVLALLGGFAAEMFAGSLSSLQYQERTLSGLRLQDVAPANLKTIVFGFLIASAGCYFGLKAKGGTEGVGSAATRGVESSIFLVLIANVALVRVIQWLVA